MIGRRWSLAVVAVALLTWLLVGSTAPSAATTGDGEQLARIELVVLDPVPWQTALPVTAEARLDVDRAISGTVTVTSAPEGLASTTYEFDVDLAAGSSARFPVDLYTGWNGVEAAATLTSNGAVVASDEVRAFGEGIADADLVAVFGIADPPARVPEIGSEDQLRTVVLDDRLRGLSRASTLVVTPGSFADLGTGTDEALAVEAWVRGGGQLVVDGPVESLDPAFHRHPTANPGRFEVGAGSVVYLTTWRDGVPLGGYLGTAGVQELVDNQGLGIGGFGELATLAGIALPSAGLIALALLVYSLLAGPLAFGVLSARGIQGRIWVVLPLLSAVFVVGIIGYGVTTRSGRTDAHITIVEVNQQGSRVTSNLLINSSFGGSRSIETPATWTYLGQGRSENQRPVRIRSGGSATEIAFEMPPGSTSLARVSGVSSRFDGMLRIEDITFDGSEVAAAVTNDGPADLVEVIAMIGNARTELGELPAGATARFSLDPTDGGRSTMRELLSWPRVTREWTNSGEIAVPVDRDAPTAAGAWTEWRIEQGSAAIPLSTIAVVGWTDDLAGPLPGFDEGRTALFVRTNLPTEVRRAVGPSTVARLASRNGEPRFDLHQNTKFVDTNTVTAQRYAAPLCLTSFYLGKFFDNGVLCHEN
ncbi:MAG: hypothetical protein AAF547_22960, partial [Actinomycetota bacterium]